jgi:hypothetical protein
MRFRTQRFGSFMLVTFLLARSLSKKVGPKPGVLD